MSRFGVLPPGPWTVGVGVGVGGWGGLCVLYVCKQSCICVGCHCKCEFVGVAISGRIWMRVNTFLLWCQVSGTC